MLEFVSDYGKSYAPLPAAIVACVPKKVHVDGIGETEFKITPEEILAAIETGLNETIEAEPEVFIFYEPLYLQILCYGVGCI